MSSTAVSRTTDRHAAYQKTRLFAVSSLALCMAGINSALRANTVHDWASHFLEALAADVKGKSFDSQLAASSFSNAVGVARTEPSTVARRAPSPLPRNGCCAAKSGKWSWLERSAESK